MKSEDIVILDTCGLFCPEPIMLLHEQIDKLNAGDRLRLICTDPTAKRDVSRFCQFLGHDLLESMHKEEDQQELWEFVIQKAGDKL